VIALCLVVLFAIIAVSLYSSMSEGPIRTISGLSSTDLDTFKKDTTRVQIITITTDSAARSTVVYRQNPGRASEDFAKQLLVMIGTLVTSVASFYFGSRAAAAGVAGPSKKPPSVAAVTPDKLTPGGETELQLTGTNLLLVTDVVAVQGSTQVRATGVTSNDTLVKCKLKLDADAPTGAWDVLATDSDNRSSRLGGAFTVAP
jgi:archaellum component FlaF (FlaF/FlaG flagellin family)